MYWIMCWFLFMLDGVVYYEWCVWIFVDVEEIEVSF